MSEANDIRGSDPVMNTKELLLEMRSDLKTFREQEFVEVRDIVKQMAAQNLDFRVNDLESFKDRLTGMSAVGAILGIVATVLSIVALFAGRVPS